MNLTELIGALSLPAAYPFPVTGVDVRQTHISVVFLAGDFVCKVKKPVDMGFLDFSTLDKRREFCEREVSLNRRLAPHVYLGVVPIVRTGDGLRFEGQGEGEVVEWAVKMLRLPDEATILERLKRGEIGVDLIAALARRIAAFHSEAERNERVAQFGRFDAVSRLILDIFSQAEPLVGTTVSPTVFSRVKTLAQDALGRLRPLIEARAERGMTRDCHGDLHLDHVYWFPDRPAPEDLVIIDCIEFNERFRCIDPVADMAFPAMDLSFHGRRDLARAFADAYFSAADDAEGRALLPLYTAYRATVRGMVEGLELTETEILEAERTAALARSRAHWLLALSELEEPGKSPCLVLVAGLPGTGKSSLAHGLAQSAGFTVIRSDVTRKELAGISPGEKAPPSLYTPEWTERTYAECRARAEKLLFEGRRAIVDATFREEKQRQAFLETAVRWGVPARLLLCQAEPETVRRRLQARLGDVSDADWAVYQQFAARWEPLGPGSLDALTAISMEGTVEQAISAALASLEHAAQATSSLACAACSGR